jgi:branched-chain amino acid transport system substrate-binding protein
MGTQRKSTGIDGKMSRRAFLKVAGGAGLAATVGFPKTARSAEDVLLGAIHPLSGPLAYDGGLLENGIKLAVEQINQGGGIKSLNGAKFRLISADSESKAEVGMSEAERLIRMGVVAIIGCYQSNVAFATTQVAERAKTPHLIDVGQADEITERGFKYTFRVYYKTSRSSKRVVNLLKYLEKNKGIRIKSAVLFHENTLWGNTVGKYIEQFLKEEGIELAGRSAYAVGSPDYTMELAKLKNLKPDVLIANAYFRDSMIIVRNLYELRFDLMGIFAPGGTWNQPKFIEQMGKLSEYIMNCDYAYNPKNPKTDKVAEAYKKRFGIDFEPSAAYAYTCVYVLKDAIERAGSSDREKIRNALAQSDFKDHILPQDAIRFDETGQNIGANPLVWQNQNRVGKVVYPNEYAESEPIFPMLPWEKR